MLSRLRRVAHVLGIVLGVVVLSCWFLDLYGEFTAGWLEFGPTWRHAPLAVGALAYGAWSRSILQGRRTRIRSSDRRLAVSVTVGLLVAGVLGVIVLAANAGCRGDEAMRTFGLLVGSAPGVVATPLLYGLRRGGYASLAVGVVSVLLGVVAIATPGMWDCGGFVFAF